MLNNSYFYKLFWRIKKNTAILHRSKTLKIYQSNLTIKILCEEF